jgi:hypothetical protein
MAFENTRSLTYAKLGDKKNEWKKQHVCPKKTYRLNA